MPIVIIVREMYLGIHLRTNLEIILHKILAAMTHPAGWWLAVQKSMLLLEGRIHLSLVLSRLHYMTHHIALIQGNPARGRMRSTAKPNHKIKMVTQSDNSRHRGSRCKIKEEFTIAIALVETLNRMTSVLVGRLLALPISSLLIIRGTISQVNRI